MSCDIKHTNKGLRRVISSILVSLVIIIVDQLTKAFAINNLSFSDAVPVIPNLIDFQLVLNAGAAFGMGQGKTFFFLLVCLVVVILSMYVNYKYKSLPYGFSVLSGMVVGGGIGNAIDRFTTGLVVDFIKIVPFEFPVFNVADIAISLGIFLIVIIVFIEDRRKSDELENS